MDKYDGKVGVVNHIRSDGLLDISFGDRLDYTYLPAWVDKVDEVKEVDPYLKDQHEPGAKLDAGKNRLGLVLLGFPRALQAVSEVGTYGAKKYTEGGWEKVPNGQQRYTDALLRHLLKEATGEELDPETEFLHAAHTAWNALARLELILRGKIN